MRGKNLIVFVIILSGLFALMAVYFYRPNTHMFFAKNSRSLANFILPLSSELLSPASQSVCSHGDGVEIISGSDKKQGSKLIVCFSADPGDIKKNEEVEAEDILTPTPATKTSSSFMQDVCKTLELDNENNESEDNDENGLVVALRKIISHKMTSSYYKKKPDLTCEKIFGVLLRQDSLDVEIAKGFCDLSDLKEFSRLKNLRLNLGKGIMCTNLITLGSRLVSLYVKGGGLRNLQFNGNKWPYLRHLELMASNILPTEILNIAGMEKLETIAIYAMKLRSIPDFSKNGELKRLNLGWNDLVNIDAHHLPQSLKNINLYGNPIDIMEAFKFSINKDFANVSVDLPKHAAHIFIK